MKKLIAVALIVGGSMLLAPAPPADACMRCKYFFTCSVDECWSYYLCIFPQSFQQSRSDCESNFYSCVAWGEFCGWV